MVSNEFWVCNCDMNNLHITDEMRCQMCGVYNDSKVSQHVYVEDILNMVYRYTAEGVRVGQLNKELEETKVALNKAKKQVQTLLDEFHPPGVDD